MPTDILTVEADLPKKTDSVFKSIFSFKLNLHLFLLFATRAMLDLLMPQCHETSFHEDV